jgi:UrcA family protein
MYRTLSAIAAVVVTALLFVPAMAQPNTITIAASAPNEAGFYEVKAVRVSLAGIDLDSSQGAATLFDRIDVAARKVCGERPGYTMNPARANIFETCRARAVRFAVTDVDAPQLTQFAAVR